MAFDMFTPPASHSCKFEQVGDTHVGKISEIGEPIQATEFQTNNPSFWPSGDPIMQAKITLETDERDPEDPRDDGKRGLWVMQSAKKGGMLWAIREAVKAAQVDTIKPGGVLQVSFVGTDPESKNPRNPRKLYQASYQAPAPAGGMFAGQDSGPAMGRPDEQFAQAADGHQQAQQGSGYSAGGPVQAVPAPQAQQAGGYAQQGFPVGNQPAPQAQQGGGQLGQFGDGTHTQQAAPAQQAPAPAQQAAPAAPAVDADTETRIKQLVSMNVDTTSIVNAIGRPDITATIVDSYRPAAA